MTQRMSPHSQQRQPAPAARLPGAALATALAATLIVTLASTMAVTLAPGCSRSKAAEGGGSKAGHDDHGKAGHDDHGKAGHDDHGKAGHDDHDKAGHDDHGKAGPDDHGKAAGTVHLSAAQRKELGVELALARPGTLRLPLELTGEVTLDPNRVAHLVPSISGVAQKVLKQLGDPVKKGELMAVLASRELARLNADYLAAQAKASLAWTEHQREKSLYAKGVSSQRDFQRARAALAEAAVQTQLTRRKLLALGLTAADLQQVAQDVARRMSHYELRAPFSGVVVAKHISHGEFLKADTQAFTVADLAEVWVTLTVYQKDLPFVRKGQPVEIAAAYGRVKAKGAIAYVSPLLSRSTRTAAARVVLDNRQGQWQPGLFVTATVTTESVAVAVLVPRSAVQQRGGAPCIYVARAGGFACQAVTLGRGTDTEVAVTKGLPPGARYVAKGGFVLKAQQEKGAFGDGHNH